MKGFEWPKIYLVCCWSKTKKGFLQLMAGQKIETWGTRVFTRGPPPHYWLGPTMFDCADRTGCGKCIVVWPQMIVVLQIGIYRDSCSDCKLFCKTSQIPSDWMMVVFVFMLELHLILNLSYLWCGMWSGIQKKSIHHDSCSQSPVFLIELIDEYILHFQCSAHPEVVFFYSNQARVSPI